MIAIIWIVGIVILGSIAAYFLGQMDDYDIEEYAGPLIGVVTFWPVIFIVSSAMDSSSSYSSSDYSSSSSSDYSGAGGDFGGGGSSGDY